MTQVIFFVSQILALKVEDKILQFNLNILKFGFNFKLRFLESTFGNVEIILNFIPLAICIILLSRSKVTRPPKLKPVEKRVSG